MGCRGRGRVPFPCTHTVEALSYFWQWRHLQLPAVKSCQGKMRKVDREPAVVLGQQPHPLAPQNFAQKHVVLLPTKMAMRPHTAYQHGLRIMRFGHGILRKENRPKKMTDEELIAEIEAQRGLMIGVATGGHRIQDVNDQYAERRQRIATELRRRGIDDPNPQADLW